MGFALFFNIIAVIVSCAASVVLIVFTAAVNDVKRDTCISHGDKCTCFYIDTHSVGDSSSETWNMKCSDLDTLRTIMIAMLAVFIILAITTFTASIFGCLGTCCAPADPVVVVTTGVPAVQGGSTVVVATNQSSMMQSGYPAAYGYPQPPAYGDKQGLVQNMAI